ncbi:MAG: Chaperone protein DnaJ [uncultured bacterium (gcode 4)]|uniref:Chaperone protein DnaJ n=1 Tax=uncultured bacterium (gcode 4) TaxID=1234023 RepID=K2G229_9BACT|nr:MAG: Chaperone protein DnaJ [uncultured bacterium (gcode 4)]
MTNKDYYDILWVDRKSTEADIKKAYRKKAMEWHPDKHKWDKKAEEKFKEINQAYEILKDPKKRQQYDSFWSAWANFWAGWQWFSWFEDIFGNFSWWNSSFSSSSFDFSDLFWEAIWGSKWRKASSNPFSRFDNRTAKTQEKEEFKLDVEKIYEVPVFDLILWTKLNIETVYGENLKLKIPEWTKPWTKFKIKEKWRKSEWKTGDMYIIVEAKMPKNIPDDVKILLESIKYRL